MLWKCKSKSKFLELNPSYSNFDLNNFEGIWKGYLQIYSSSTEIKSVPMSLKIKKELDNQYQWNLQYFSQDSRNYIMTLDSSNRNKFILDECNGIKLQGSIRGNILSFYFEVENNLLDCKYIFNKYYIDFLIITGITDQNLISKEFVMVEDTSGSIVKSYYMPYFQSARLYKQSSTSN